MLAIMITDKPRWACLMMNGDKTIEVRKNEPLAKAVEKLIAMYGKARIYVYVSKSGYKLSYGMREYDLTEIVFLNKPARERVYFVEKKCSKTKFPSLNGKVAFMFECEKVEDIKYKIGCPFPYFDFESKLSKTCLTEEELEDYLFTKKGFKKGYAIHIDKLTIFDKPKEISEFYKTIGCEHCAGEWNCPNENKVYGTRLTKAPQNFAYIEVEE